MPTEGPPRRTGRRRFPSPVVQGNINLHSRPVVRNRDGTISTVRSISIGTDQGEVLIPTVVNGRVVSDEEAIAEYRRTGQHLGIFRTPQEADAYARHLHEEQAREYAPRQRGRQTSGLTIDRHNNPGALRVPGSNQFQRFPTVQAGVRAQERQLGRYFGRGLNTVRRVVETYAPRMSRGGDNTDAQVNNYVAHVARRLGISPDQPMTRSVISRLASAMREFETGRR